VFRQDEEALCGRFLEVEVVRLEVDEDALRVVGWQDTDTDAETSETGADEEVVLMLTLSLLEVAKSDVVADTAVGLALLLAVHYYSLA
jgi:hypothetical protein